MKSRAKRELSYIIKEIPQYEETIGKVMAAISTGIKLPEQAAVLDIGCAQGLWVYAAQKSGFAAYGVEPSPDALRTSCKLQQVLGVDLPIMGGIAESIPVASSTFDLVLASSVLEHVAHPGQVFSEVYRVLKRPGAFWFYTTNSLCPLQSEIRGYPLFPWYPDSVKRKIMEFCKEHRPKRVGYSDAPAMNWFTPWKAKRMLTKAGFIRVLDRWDLATEEHLPGRARRLFFLVRFIRRTPALKVIADIFRPGCSYLALKA